MADLLPRNRVLPNTTSQRGDTSQVLPSMRSPSSYSLLLLTGLFTHKSLRDVDYVLREAPVHMSESGETDSRSIGSSDNFRATAA
ncbi:hypothetical protein TNCV_2013871 [Trichonephila clavipes]|nr:hypothetical protein TNCV_2013871 [Trichonephila clavipes]